MVARVIACPACEEDEELVGQRTEEGILITCARCGAEWWRDSEPAPCVTCGSADVEVRPQAMTRYARGTQVSIVGFRHAPLCTTCDAEMLSRIGEGRPIPDHYMSAASTARPDNETSLDTTILPGGASGAGGA